MEHSVQEYIQRLPTEQLAEFLRKCLQGELTEHFDAMIPLIQAELDRRKI